jgi:hypothetical protein
VPNLPNVKTQSVPTERTIAITKIDNNELYESGIANVARQHKRECPGCGVSLG